MDLQLEGTVAFVAGSSRGIGLAIAEGFLGEGAMVTITGRDRKTLDAAADKLSGQCGEDRVLAVCGDLRVEQDIQAALDRTTETFGGIDAVVANVGTGRSKMGWDIPQRDWREMIDANLMSGVLLAGAGASRLKERGGGSITFISSIAGSEIIPAPMPYAAAKAAQQMAAKYLAHQLGPAGIRVNTVSPGNVLFPGGIWDRKLKEDKEGVERTIAETVPLNRFGAPSEIADAVLFLSSARAAFITGEVLVVDGGQTRS